MLAMQAKYYHMFSTDHAKTTWKILQKKQAWRANDPKTLGGVISPNPRELCRLGSEEV
jgi:hypothetical protein